MKIRKSTVVWSILALLLLVTVFYDIDEASDYPTWKDATYVKDGKVLPENEGKLVAVSGRPVPIENAYDEITGVEFPSPKVYRYVDRIRVNSAREGEWIPVYPGKSSDGIEEGYILGRIGIGDFEIDKDLITRTSTFSRDMVKKDFSDEIIAKLEETGYVDNYEGTVYYSTIPCFSGVTGINKVLYPDWENAYRMRWKMWEPDEDDEVTVVGIQKGNTLTYCELNTTSSEMKYMDEEDFREKIKVDETDYSAASAVLAAVCLIMAIRSLFKKKKEEDEYIQE